MYNTELKKHALEVKKNIVTMVHAATSEHLGRSLRIEDILNFLYFIKTNIDIDNVISTNRDRFVLSNDRTSISLYGICSCNIAEIILK